MGSRDQARTQRRRAGKNGARFNRRRRSNQRLRYQRIKSAAKLAKRAIGSVAALSRRNAVLVVRTMQLLAGRDADEAANLGATNRPLPRDDKRDSERDRSQ